MKIVFLDNKRGRGLGRMWINHKKEFDYDEENWKDLYKYVPGGENDGCKTRNKSKV